MEEIQFWNFFVNPVMRKAATLIIFECI